MDGFATIWASTFRGNEASRNAGAIEPNDPNDPPIVPDVANASGGGLYIFTTEADIRDCVITGNNADGSGGGVYLGGHRAAIAPFLATPELFNCLIANNRAGRDGGGISANWYVEALIRNCTIVNNEVAGTNAYGGGIHCAYECNVEVIDSIIWGNVSSYEGSQVAVASGDWAHEQPATLKITNSDIQPEMDIEGVTGLDIAFCVDTTGSMSGEIEAVKDSMAEIVAEIAARASDYRIAAVTYEDYGVDYNFPTDAAYEDDLPFESDLDTIVAGVNSITLGFGGDGPETLYAGLMHLIDAAAHEARLDANGAGDRIDPNSPGVGEWRTGVSRAIIVIGDAIPKDPEPYTGYTMDEVITAADEEDIVIYTIPVGTWPLEDFNSLSEGTGGAMLEAATPQGVVDAIMAAIQLITQAGPPIYVEPNCVLVGWNPDTNSWDPNTRNIAEDPNFIMGYYLSQPVLGLPDMPLSPCVDTGSPNDVAGIGNYTTRIDGILDSEPVDMGYHYPEAIPYYHLTVTVLEDPNDPGIHGYVDPNDVIVYQGFNDVVMLTAHPDPNYRVRAWYGTDDDASTASENTVTVTGDTEVTVEFEAIPTYTLTVTVPDGHGTFSVNPAQESYLDGTTVTLTAIPEPNYFVRGWYDADDGETFVSRASTLEVLMDSDKNFILRFKMPNTIEVSGGGNAIRDRLAEAENGDILIVEKGTTYNGDIDFGDKQGIKLVSIRPDDPEIIATTIIDCNIGGRAFILDGAQGPDTVIQGFTITGGSVTDGSGGTIYIGEASSPTIVNLIISNSTANNGDGGAIFVGMGSHASFRNIVITNSSAVSGDGGAIYVSASSSPVFNDCVISNSSAPAGSGGAVYCAESGSPVFIDCRFRLSSAGQDGGALYYGDNSVSVLTRCSIRNNQAVSGAGVYYGANCFSQLDTCVLTDNAATAFGGAVRYESDSFINITDCNFADNQTAVDGGALYVNSGCFGAIADTFLVGNDANADGGAIFLTNSDIFLINDCNVNDNTATRGAGFYFYESPAATVLGCTITGNRAFRASTYYEYYLRDPNDPNHPLEPDNPVDQSDPNFDPSDPNYMRVVRVGQSGVAQGGGIYSWKGPLLFADCNISYNTAVTSGAGIFLIGDYDPETDLGPEIINCLVTNNRAGTDGAGISCNWLVQPTISNCTIADNELTKLGSYGAGLYCSYWSQVEVIDCIIRGNRGRNGSQIAVASGDPNYAWPSKVNITHSDIQVFQEEQPDIVEPNVITPEVVDPSLLGPNTPDYFIYGYHDLSQYGAPQSGWCMGLYGWLGDDGADRIIFWSRSYDPNTWEATNDGAYIFKVTVPDDADPHAHPDNPYAPGEIAERTFELERIIDMGDEFTAWGHHASEFHVDVQNNVIYVGAYQDGVLKYVFDDDADNPVDGGPDGNYVYDSRVTPPPPGAIVTADPSGWGWNRTETLGYDAKNDIWYAGVREHYTLGEVLKYDGSQGPDGQWESAFTYTPMDLWDHHDGMEFIDGHLYVSDMYGDNVLKFTPDGTLVDVFSHEPFTYELESMGWGALQHFWAGTFQTIVTEFGGGALQISVGGGTRRPVSPPIYVEEGCVLTGWSPDDPNDFFTWDVNSWDPNTHNIDEDPLFVGGYYLSQPIAGYDLPVSPCVDAGHALAAEVGLDAYTTAMDGAFDVNDSNVDMGYHYRQGLPPYHLTVYVVDANGVVLDANQARGYVDPNYLILYGGYNQGEVDLTAYPDPNYRVRAWYGTDDDNSVDVLNTVTVTEDTTVTIEFEPIPVYQLTVTVVGAHGTAEPNTGAFLEGTVVPLTAIPEEDYRVMYWNGSDNDSTTALTNTVTMNQDRSVTIEFESTNSFIIPGGPYSSISGALDALDPDGSGRPAVRDGDKIVLAGGTFPENHIEFDGRSVTITTERPDDPCWVGNTVIDGGGNGPIFIFHGGENVIIDGITIRNGWTTTSGGLAYSEGPSSPTFSNCIIENCGATGINGFPGAPGDPNDEGPGGLGGNGTPGQDALGGAMYFVAGSSPTIRNCTIRDCLVVGGQGGAGGRGGDGVRLPDADVNTPGGGPGGNAAPGGNAYAGLMYCENDCQVTILGSTIEDCLVRPGLGNVGGAGGNGMNEGDQGGNGGAGSPNGSQAYYGAMYYGPRCEVTVARTTFANNMATSVGITTLWPGGAGGLNMVTDNNEPRGLPGPNGVSATAHIAGTSYYSYDCTVELADCNLIYSVAQDGGGAEYYENNCHVVMNDCNFSDNFGGGDDTTGQGGAQRFGDLCVVDVNHCIFVNNLADSNGGAQRFGADCTVNVRRSGFLDNSGGGDGGALSFQTGCSLQIDYSRFTGNSAESDSSSGGALYWGYDGEAAVSNTYFTDNYAVFGGALCWLGNDANVLITGCTLNQNTALDHGGGLYWTQGAPIIRGCIIRDNTAGGPFISVRGENIYGGGGGLFGWSSDAVIEDCYITGNISMGAGGAVYLGNIGSPTINNCLFAENSAILDGGAIAAYWLTKPAISSCTIVDNLVYDPDNDEYGRGGGLACFYQSAVTLEDSILWGNKGVYGDQIAVGGVPDPDAYPWPAELAVSYCDIQDWKLPDPPDAINPDAVFVQPGGILDWDANSILDEDPLLVSGYFLSQEQDNFSPCVDASDKNAADVGLDVLTTRIDLITDAGLLDFGYHYPAQQYELSVEVTAGNGTVSPNSGLYNPLTILTLTATPDPCHAVKGWYDENGVLVSLDRTIEVMMNSDKAFTVEFRISRKIKVPLEVPTIADAIAKSRHGDEIILLPGTYSLFRSGTDPNGLDFRGKRVTLRSMYPNDPVCIASTIIDASGTRYFPQRAFNFHSGEGPDTRVLGITIQNAYWRGIAGAPGVYAALTPQTPPRFPYEPIDPDDDQSPPRAQAGYDSPVSNGYGGGIICDGASPNFKNCVITGCIVGGGQGGDGARGQHAGSIPLPWLYLPPGAEEPLETDDGQYGGHAGDGHGNGYGGAFCLLNRSCPTLINCVIADNTARGGRGGFGGNAGNASEEPPWSGNFLGMESGTGNGGNGYGDGFGGGIYCDIQSRPTIVNCVFSNNIARQGIGDRPGFRGGLFYLGMGNPYTDYLGENPPPKPLDGTYGTGFAFIQPLGGGAYYGLGCDPNIVNCEFTGNEAVVVADTVGVDPLLLPFLADSYTLGGGIFSEPYNKVTLLDSNFVGNLAGAVYCQDGTNLKVENCLFQNNLITADGGGALHVGRKGFVDVNDSIFTANRASGAGGALDTQSDAVVRNSRFSRNMAGGYGGAINGYCDTGDPNTCETLTFDINSCFFGQNQTGGQGGSVHFKDFNAGIADCYMIFNAARSGGACMFRDGNVTLTGGLIYKNIAAGGDNFDAGGALACSNTGAVIEDCTIEENSVLGTYGRGGAIALFGGRETIKHRVKNCIMLHNTASLEGGAISCNIYASPKIQNCTFSGDSAGLYGGAISCEWTSSVQVSDSIFENCDNHAICEQDFGDATVKHTIFYNNPDGDYAVHDMNSGQVTVSNGSDLDPTNQDADPIFVPGPLGAYYLHQNTSPAVDTGSTDADILGLDTRTTDPNGILDTGVVDIGYHYGEVLDVPLFGLKLNVVGTDGALDIVGPEPIDYNSVTDTYYYYAGALVVVQATPDLNYRLKRWTGTVDDASTAQTNVVLMIADQQVTVRFDQLRTIVVGSDPNYTSIQHAIDDANDGDIVLLPTGRYTPAYLNGNTIPPLTIVGKGITLTSKNPDDPNCVAATILDGHVIWVFDVSPFSFLPPGIQPPAQTRT
ncbi:MAG: right-handed parallel beta-helix repeat-containing protein, partial [Planctomycetota bacterium]